jgi:hypothetical protein
MDDFGYTAFYSLRATKSDLKKNSPGKIDQNTLKKLYSFPRYFECLGQII